jgi:hypothetical protein
MYRYRNNDSERAHRMLGQYYHDSARYVNAAEHLLFSVLIQTTTIIEEYSRRDSLFVFTTLPNLMETIERRSDLRAYLVENDYYRTLYYLGQAFYGSGKNAAARSCWTFLSGAQSAGEWQRRASAQLTNPVQETPREVLDSYRR